jgi:hypothetical protein
MPSGDNICFAWLSLVVNMTSKQYSKISKTMQLLPTDFINITISVALPNINYGNVC